MISISTSKSASISWDEFDSHHKYDNADDRDDAVTVTSSASFLADRDNRIEISDENFPLCSSFAYPRDDKDCANNGHQDNIRCLQDKLELLDLDIRYLQDKIELLDLDIISRTLETSEDSGSFLR
jgi:hypothetical protein